ncbi:MAG TPA: MlaD family protein [Salinivirgaceae bacterium]|nr:MlaD family protein [Salinivirgaceae bacterium]
MALSHKSKFALIGLLVSIGIFILIWGLNYLKGKDFFSNENYYSASYKHVSGLSQSSSVLFNGFKVGSVHSIKINFEQIGNIDVVIGVDPKINIPVGSTARIVSIDLMGTKAIELEFTDNKRYHKVGDTLISDTEESLKDQVSIQMLPLKHKAEDLLKEMEEAIRLIRLIFNEKTREDIQQAFTHINSSTRNINNITGKLDTLFLNKSDDMQATIANIRSLTDNLNKSNKEIRQIISNLDKTTDSISNISFISLTDNINKTTASVKYTMERIEKGEGTVGKMMQNDTLYYSLVEAIESLNKLVEDLNENPKKYFNFSVFDFSKEAKK